MRNKIVAVLIIVVVVCVAWIGVLKTDTSETGRVEELVQQINANIEVKTYKNTLALYEELIKLEPKNINWYVDLANTYVLMEQYGNYKKMCEQIVGEFPNDKTGYLMLMKYYEAAGENSDVVTTYYTIPEEIKADSEIAELYKKYEWQYNYLASAYNSISVCTGGTYVIEYNGLYGYKNKDVSSEIEPVFEVARPFIDSYAAVYKDDEWYFIDGAGDRVLATKQKLQDLYSISEGVAVAKINGKYGFVDTHFNQYAFEYDDVTSFYNGVAAVKKNGKWALMNNKFELISSFEYDDVIRDDANICSRKGVIFLKKNGVYHMIDIQGQEITSEVFNDACMFYSEYAAVKKGDKWGFIDRTGNAVIDFTFDEASSFASGIAAVKKGSKWGCINLSGEIILDYEYEHAMITADNGVVVLKIGELYRFIKFTKFN